MAPAAAREIPDKLYFRIGEVSRLCEVPAYVLRFWEGEFPQLKPNKGGTGQRLYRRRDVEMALRIKTLLYDEGYTIPGARQAFKTELRNPKDAAGDGTPEQVDTRHLLAIRKELREIHALLSRPATGKAASQPVQSIRAPKPAAKVAASTLVAFPRPLTLGFPKPRHAETESLFDHLPDHSHDED